MKFKLDPKVITSLMAVVAGLLAGALLILVAGHNPIEGYLNLFKGGLYSIERVGNALALATPLILTGLSLAFANKTGLFNIGAAGQMLMGGFFAVVFALYVPFPRPIMVPCVILASMIGGALWGFIPGVLKAIYNVNEVVSTIMMNWIAYWTVSYVVQNFIPESKHVITVSQRIPPTATLRLEWLTELFNKSYVNMGLFLAVIAAILVGFIINRTVLGYELRSVGFNRYAAEYAGIPVNRSIIAAMSIAGSLAGLAGATYYCGYSPNLQANVLPSQGFDGIAVALLGLNNPLGVVISAIFFGIMQAGKNYMSAQTSIPPEIADTIIAVIIYFAATAVLMQRLLAKVSKRKKGGKA